MVEAELPSRYYYATPGCEGLLQQLQHLLRFGEGLPVVQAGRSAGKSAMAAELSSRLEDVPFLVSLKCGVEQNIGETLGTIVHEFGISDEQQLNAGESLATLRQFAAQLVNDKQLAVLILDDAHLLDSQSLGAVISLLQGNNLPGYGLHLVFFASPGLVERVDELGLIDAPVYDFEIPLFSPSELSSFLKKKFSNTSTGFNANLVQQIWSQSLGSPGVALRLALDAHEEGESKSDTLDVLSKIPKGHMLALGVLVAVLLWAAFARDSGEEKEGLGKQPELANAEGGVAEKRTVLTPKVDKAERTASTDDVAEEAKGKEIVQQEAVEKMAQEDGAVIVDSQAKPLPAIPVSQEANNKAVSAPRQLEAPDNNASKEGAALVKKPEVLPEVKIQSSSSVSIPPKKEGLIPATPPTPSGMTANELFLMDQSPDTYTLQIIAASRKDALIKYISAQANKNELYLYQGLREGKAWFVVVTGIFTSRQEAQAAIQGLPSDQRKGGPWPRQLKDIQYEIAANRSR